MELRKHICWKARQVHEVIKIDAEAVKDNVFQAVHTDQPILMSTTDASNFKTASGEEFLKTFTSPDTPEVFSLVLGDSGAGKTHFIHWLRLNVPIEKNTRIVNIPKVGTSLRSILRLLIEQLPEELQAKYLDQLTRIGNEIQTEEQRQEKLLNALAQTMSAETRGAMDQDPERLALLEGLASLLYDPHIRKHWFLADRPDSIIKELTQHIYEAKRVYSRQEQDRHFKPSDFDIKHIKMADVSLQARGMLNLFRLKPAHLQAVADIANQCLDAAIGEALSFSGEDLVALVAEVRRHLHEKGLDLILYIEDLSRMQGVDKALLDALTVPSIQEGYPPLCTIRWVAAMTTGYFDRLEDTIGTRINLMGKVVAHPEIWEGTEAKENLALFVGRYLNAVRLGIERIEEWETTTEIPNACDTCVRKDYCHDAFGRGGEFGMYPFTPEAVLNMAERSVPDNEDWFKPRRLLKNIVTPMLAIYGPDILDGRFPPPSMVEEIGKGRMDALEKGDLQQIAGADFDRHLALQELWQPSNKIVPFHEDLLTAFNLRQLRGKQHDGTPTAAKPSPKTPTTTASNGDRTGHQKPANSSKPAEIEFPILDKLRDWGNGKAIDDQTANGVRGLVFEALKENVDWDRAGVARGPYVGKNNPFRPTSIYFEGQLTKSNAPIQLRIPLQEDDVSYFRSATALQGLYLFDKHGHWDFPDGPRYLVQTQSCLEEWAQATVELVKNFPPNDKNWNAVNAATELLCVGASLTGIIALDSAKADLWSSIWGDSPETATMRLLSNEMQGVAKAIANDWKLLQTHVRSRSAGTKNSSIGDFLNPKERESVLSRLKKNHWSLNMSPDLDADMHKDFKDIAKLYIRVAQGLPQALEAESKLYNEWLEKMDAEFGEKSRSEILETFSGLQAGLNDGAILPSLQDRFQQFLDDFSGAAYQDAKKRAGMVAGKDSSKLGPHLFAKNGVVSAMRKARALADETGPYLDKIDEYYTTRMKELKGAAGNSLEACWDEISRTLDELDETLDRLGNQDKIEGQKQ